MQVLTKEQQKLIIEFIDGDLLDDELVKALGPIPFDTPSLLIRLLESAVATDNAAAADEALGIAHGFKDDKTFVRTIVPALLALLAMECHYRHEDIVGLLQRSKDIRAVEGLYQTALAYHSYLGYDDTSGLARKCTWALADIGGADAYSKLHLLATNDNPHIAHYAQKRLDSWQKELPRKAHKFTP